MKIGSSAYSTQAGLAAMAAGAAPTTPLALRVPGSEGTSKEEGPSGLGSARTDSAEFSSAALGLAEATEGDTTPEDGAAERDGREQDTNDSGTGSRGADGEPLSSEEEEEVRELKARDQEVRAHEEAHKAAAGDLALSGPTYEYDRGPDGKEYAVGGEVQIALRSGETPQESVELAQRARRAALAPAEPSAQDLKVASEAARMEAEALQEVAEEQQESARGAGAQAGASSVVGDSGPSSQQLARRASAYEEVSQGDRQGTRSSSGMQRLTA